MRTIKQFNDEMQALKYQQEVFAYERNLVEENLDDTLHRYDQCHQKAQVDREIYQYLFDYTGVFTNLKESRREFYDSTVPHAVRDYAVQFVANTCPYQMDNFAITPLDELIDTCTDIYYLFGSSVSREDVVLKANWVLQQITAIINQVIYGSNFYNVIPQPIISSLTRQGDLLLTFSAMTGSRRSPLSCKLIHPFSIFYDYNDEQEIVGVYRELKIKPRDILLSYPGFDASLLEKKAPYEPVCLREACYLKFIEGFQKNQWVYLVADENKKIGFFTLYDFNPFITFCENLPIGSNVGQGRLFPLYPSIRRVEVLAKTALSTVQWNNNPPIEINDQAIAPNNDFTRTGKEIRPGKSIHVNSNNAIIPLPMRDASGIMEELIRLNEFHQRVILGEMITPDPRATATLTTAQISRQTNFMVDSQGRIQEQFMFPILRKVFMGLVDLGYIPNMLMRNFQRSPEMLPQKIAVMTNDNMRLQALSEFVNVLVERFGSLDQVSIKLTAPIGFKQNLEDVNRLVSFCATLSQMLVPPITDTMDARKIINKLATNMHIDQGLILTENETRQRQEAAQVQNMEALQMEAMMKAQQKQLEKQTA